MELKIQLTHPAGKKAVSMNKAKYEILKKAILKHLSKKGESTHTEIWNAVAEDLKKKKTKFEGSVQWHVEWVKLDLESNKLIQRVAKMTPPKYILTK